jgi:uncharacterized OsmC-like protein
MMAGAQAAGRRSEVGARQAPLREAYAEDPRTALIVDRGRTVDRVPDAPNPGELLCAALAACQDSTVRMVANLLAVELTALAVDVEGDVDLRGTPAVDLAVPVGFQAFRCRTRVGVAPDTPARTVELLLKAAERSCVVLDTPRRGIAATSEFDVERVSAPSRSARRTP